MARSTVTKIETGFSNTVRIPYAYAHLACGHDADVKVKPIVFECVKCGTERIEGSDHKCVTCGTSHSKYKFQPNPHKEEDRLTKVGDEVDCRYCGFYEEALAKLKALKPGDVSHSRFRTFDSRGIGPGAIYVYQLDSKSPSGCRLLLSIDDTPEVEAILRGLRAAPLSPTEAR